MAYDLIGDVHGCREELVELLRRLGYHVSNGERAAVTPPQRRRAIFLGDVVNRGPDTPGTLRLVMSMFESGCAAGVLGNHDLALGAALLGQPAKKVDALSESLAQLAGESEDFRQGAARFLMALPRRLILQDGELVVAHAGLPEAYQRRQSARADDFAVHGRWVRGADGKRKRYAWAEDYRGHATVVYGHASQLEARWLNRTICIDTGCVYGGRLTALRYPELELVQVPARRVYYETPRSPEFRAAALAGT